MSQKRIVILGSSHAAHAASTTLRELSPHEHAVAVISKRDHLPVAPSLVDVVFDERAGLCPGVSVRERLETLGIRYVPHDATQVDLDRRRVGVGHAHEPYDALIIATGARPNYGAIPGFGPQGYTHCVMSLAAAERARAALQRIMQNPGPIVVGAVRGAISYHAAYDFALRVAARLQSCGLSGAAPITFVTAESCVGDFGADESHVARLMTEALFERFGIRAVTSASIRSITRDELTLGTGERIPFAYAMIVPSMLGVDVVRACDKIANPAGFVRIDQFCRAHEYPEVFAAGTAAEAPHDAASPCAELPITARVAQQMGRAAAFNAIADLEGAAPVSLDPRVLHAACVVDTTAQAVSMLSSHYRTKPDQTIRSQQQ